MKFISVLIPTVSVVLLLSACGDSSSGGNTSAGTGETTDAIQP